MKKEILSIFFLFGLLFTHSLRASHIAGGDLSYVCLGNNQYQINLNLFADCVGLVNNPLGLTQTVTFSSTCGDTTIEVNVSNPGGTEISQLCPTQINNSTCNSGNLPGMRVFHFTGTVTFAQACNWVMGWDICCRNAAIINLQSPGSAGIYIQATLNGVTAPCNNSPSFTSQPIPYVCANQLVNYNYGVVETDGDSLHYSLINAWESNTSGGGLALPYTTGYSAASPIPGITVNPITGVLSFTPASLGSFVVVVLVQEYDSNGNLMGTVMRDIQFVVQNCTNAVPDPTAGAISNLTGTAVQASPFSIEMCESSSFTFNATYTDANAGDVLSSLSNISSVLPGATLTTTGSNPLVATISWTAPGGSANTNTTFSVTINDGACPIMGQQTFVYDIIVQPRTLGGADHIICGTQGATLHGTGGSIFTWNVLSGSPLVVGTNFSCNPCTNPIASPTTTTTYEVISDLSGTCINKDTVIVTVVPDFSYVTSQSSTSSCLLQPIQFNAVGSPSGVYTYHWFPSTYLNNTTIANPVATITSPGVYTYYVTITSAPGCVKVDTASINITASYPPNPITTASNTTVCVGDTVQLGVTFGNSVPSFCGTNLLGCSTALVATVGTGTLSNTSSAYPAPYGNFYTSAKHQFLFKASELSALGITGGKIDQIDFNVSAVNGITTYHEYTIKMGCTNLNALSNWVTGLSNVYTPKTYNVVPGWNAHAFDLAYEWDGLSNIVIEICFNEMPPTYTYSYNCSSPYTTTPFVSCLYSNSDDVPQCPDLSSPTTTNKRPNVRFHYCGSAPDSSRYTYSWMPVNGILNPHAQTSAAVVSVNTNYYVIVTDTVSGCLDTASINVSANTTSLNVDAGNEVTICPGVPTTLSATGASQFVWSPATALSSTTAATTTANPTATITYTVTGTSQCAVGAGIDSVKVTVPVVSPFTISAGDNQEACVATSYFLSASTSGGFGNNIYSWTLLSGASIDSIINSHTPGASVTPTVSGTNIYLVSGKDACGYVVTDTVVVEVILDCGFEIPNIFTPNGDGNNDYFLIDAKHLKTYSIVIYNRWGNIVFESDNATQSWDGKNVESGTYFYILKAEGINGKLYDAKGFVQCIGK